MFYIEDLRLFIVNRQIEKPLQAGPLECYPDYLTDYTMKITASTNYRSIGHKPTTRHILTESLMIAFSLTKARLTFFIALSTLIGYVLYDGKMDLGLIRITMGLMLLAGGCACLNNIQDAVLDARMPRTVRRAIPSGKISKSMAMTLALSLILTGLGSLMLSSRNPLLLTGLGVSAIILYNGIYTPLKRKSFLAVIPGALLGAIGPLAGWIAAGGRGVEPTIVMVMMLFIFWQLAHFWLINIMYGQEYTQANIPNPTMLFTPPQLCRIALTWTMATASTAIMISLRIATVMDLAMILTGVATVILLYKVIRIQYVNDEDKNSHVRSLYLYQIFYIFIIMVFFFFHSI